MWWIDQLRRLRTETRGMVTLLTVGSLMALIGMLAISVDAGSVYLDSRRLQGIADSAALAAVGTSGDSRAAAEAIIAASGWSRPYTLVLTPGTYAPDSSLAPAARFSANTGVSAARVTLTSDVRLFFAAPLVGRRVTTVVRRATAARLNAAAFSIGSRVAAVDGGVGNALLSALLGTTVSLSVADYNALLSTDVDAFAYTDALRTQLHLQGASYADTLAATATMPQALTALATTLTAGGNTAAAAAVARLVAASSRASDIKVGTMIDLGTTGAQDHVTSNTHALVNAFDMVRTALALANGGRQVQVTLAGGVPGLTTSDLWIATGQAMASSPWLTVTDKGTPIIRTAQSRIYLSTSVGTTGALGALGLASVNLPLYIELASAQAKLTSVACSGGNANVTLSVLPSIGHASIATVDPTTLNNFATAPTESTVSIARAALGLITVTGQSRVDFGGAQWQSVPFSAADIAAGTTRTVSTGDTASAVTASLVQRLSLNINVIGFGLNASTISGLVGTQLQTMAPLLDGVLNNLTNLLGIHLGQADTRVNGVRCGIPALVA